MGETGIDVPSYIEAEATNIDKPGFVQTKQLIKRYGAILTAAGNPDENQVDVFLKRYGLGVKGLVADTFSAYGTPLSKAVVRTDATNSLLDRLIGSGRDKLRLDPKRYQERESMSEEVDEYETQNTKERLDTDLNELEEVLQFQQYVNGVINKTAWPASYRGLQQKMNRVVNICKANVLKNLINRGDELFAEDVAGVLEERMPRPQGRLTDSERFSAIKLLDAVNKIIIVAEAPNDLKKDYLQLLIPLKVERDKLIKDLQIYSVDTRLKFLDDYLSSEEAIKEFSASIRDAEWQHLAVTPEQTRKIYDIVSPTLLNRLFQGGRESWEGTYAASAFAILRDPRVLPHLIAHLREFGPGHTSNIVASAIEKIVKNPLEKQDLELVLAQAQPLQRMIINKWFQDHNTAVYKIIHGILHEDRFNGYGVATMVQQAEQYMARGELLDLAVGIIKSQGKGVDWEDMREYLYTGFSEALEGVFLQDLDQAAAVIAKSHLSDWKSFFPKVFHDLINPKDGEIAKFPKLIAKEGLGLSIEELNKIDKLYQSGDLRRGAMARSSFTEGLLLLASKEEGPAIMKAILAISTGANRDPERIREIFTLLRSLDSFGRFEFTKRPSLGETISDLKNKLVSIVAEKMEIRLEETQILHGRLDELTKTGVFEIIPHLLARFHEQKKEDVALVVREIGRHIVLGDFRQWRNTLDTAVAQLVILPEDKQSLWLNSVSEVNLEMGLTTDTEARQGAVDTIRRIASEAKAHILEVYKLDFSVTGISTLKQKQQDLIQALKDTTKEPQEKRDLGIEKRGIDDQLRIIEGILGLENLSVNNLDPVLLNKHFAGIINSMNSFQGLSQAVSDLAQITEVLTTQAEIGNITKLRVFETDDPMALLKVGIEPRETCQSYRNGSHNYCLPAYVADANKRVINVENDSGEVLGRSVMKLTHIKDNNGQTHPAILLEPIYTTSEIAPVYRGVAKIALEKAKAIGAYLILARDYMVHTGENNERLVPVIETEAKKEGRQYKIEDAEVFVPKSFNPYEYSDSLGGVISYFDTYHRLSETVVVRP